MSYPPEFLQRVDEFVALANRMAKDSTVGNASAAILFAAGRYNAFNFLATGGTGDQREQAVQFYTNEYRKALVSNMDGVVGPVMNKPD